jgi:hypothetical protein
MAWTRKIPTAPGFYWYTDSEHDETVIELTMDYGPVMHICFVGAMKFTPATEFGGQHWNAPIGLPPVV